MPFIEAPSSSLGYLDIHRALGALHGEREVSVLPFIVPVRAALPLALDFAGHLFAVLLERGCRVDGAFWS